ncbi:MAG: PDZ domain-containing protein [Solirubrobacteraceae bacterium]
MSGPKHLWSGDWENESDEASAKRVREPRPAPEPVVPPPEAGRVSHPRRPRRSVRPWVLPVAIGALVIATAAFGVSKLFGSSQPAHQGTTSALRPLPAPRVTGNPRPIMWLGMEIVTAAPGVPVVETVRPNSNGDLAGLEPGDALLLINNRPVGSTGNIADAIKGLHSGDKVTLEVNNGGAIFQVVATLAAPPSPYP